MNSLRRRRPWAERSIGIFLGVIGPCLIGLCLIGPCLLWAIYPFSSDAWDAADAAGFTPYPGPDCEGVVLDRIVDGSFAVYLVGEREREIIIPWHPRSGCVPVPDEQTVERVRAKQTL